MTSLKDFLVVAVCCLGVGYAFGVYYAQPPSTKDAVKTDVQSQKDTEIHSITVTEEEPSGAKKTTTTTDTASVSSRISAETVKSSTTASPNPTYHASILYGYDVSNRKSTYGLSIDRRLLGPVSIGVWGLTNNTLGVSLGVSF